LRREPRLAATDLRSRYQSCGVFRPLLLSRAKIIQMSSEALLSGPARSELG
jgi:hypothetical protein